MSLLSIKFYPHWDIKSHINYFLKYYVKVQNSKLATSYRTLIFLVGFDYIFFKIFYLVIIIEKK